MAAYYGVPQNINFKKLLGGDEQLQGTLAGLKAQGNALTTNLNTAANQSLAEYGAVPGNFGPISQSLVIDPVTRGLAQQNTQAGTSTIAQLQDAYNRQQSASVGDIGARGIARSGAYQQHAVQNLQNYNIAQFNAQKSLMDTLNSLYSNYQTNQQGLTGQGVNATQDALDRIVQLITAGVISNPVKQAPPVAAPTFQVVPGRGRALL